MNELTINIDDYLSEDEKRHIVREQFRIAVNFKAREDLNTILENTAYHLVVEEVNKALDGNMVQKIKEKALQVIEGLTSYTVFYQSNYSHRSSRGWDILQKAAEDYEPQIRERFLDAINEIPASVIREKLEYSLVGAIMDKLGKKDEDAF